jgi:hypothetical protein
MIKKKRTDSMATIEKSFETMSTIADRRRDVRRVAMASLVGTTIELVRLPDLRDDGGRNL